MQLALPPTSHQYQRPRQLSLPFGSQEPPSASTSSGRRPSRDMLLPPPPRPSSRNTKSNSYSGVYGYPSQDSAHARALADACSSLQLMAWNISCEAKSMLVSGR